ncbi:hypothetical protein J5N97_029218 [Dioscorea zingiberensis]|uniref:SHSP domain-containing protein n=1 Tax=Dioscorea zingiberensis TaxID=325984 RepID=A0A9D5H5E7_9LILI|nr:hypothetical protein J5N97_029218 [Dioscorea zingiberensis]
MDSKQRSSPAMRSYEPYDPTYQMIEGGEADTLSVHLPGFKKEQIKVQVDTFGTLRVNAERPIEGNRWSRVRKDFIVPKNCNVNEIKAKFENGILYVILPKPITQTDQVEPVKPIEKPPVTQNQMQDDGMKEEAQMPRPMKSPPGDTQSRQEKLRYGISKLHTKVRKPSKLMMNVIAAIIVLLGVGIYVKNKMGGVLEGR